MVTRTIPEYTCKVCGYVWLERQGAPYGKAPLRCADRANCGTFHWRDTGAGANGRKGKG